MNKKLIIACCIITILYVGCSLIPHHTEFDDKTVPEDAMEMSLPNYKICRFSGRDMPFLWERYAVSL